MCRYGMRMYKPHMVCFPCRLAFKSVFTCPKCQAPMTEMGLDFKVPPKRDNKWWKNVEILSRAGFRFSSCGCTGPGYGGKKDKALGKRLAGAQEFLNQWFATEFPAELKNKKNGWRKPKVARFAA